MSVRLMVALGAALCALAWPTAAGAAPPAYIDPNTGGMLFQILAAVFAFLSGLVLVFAGRIRLWVARLRRRLRERNAAANHSEPPPDAGQ